MSFFRAFDGGLDLLIWVAPRASRPGLGPLHGERLRAAVSAPPVDGAANEALRELFAEALSVPRGAVSIVQGATEYAAPARSYSNLWVIRLDADGRCREFTEWWMERDP